MLTVAALLLAACASSSRPEGPLPPSRAPNAPILEGQLQPLAWLVGDWRRAGGGLDSHWTFAGDALFGVDFPLEGFVVRIVTLEGGKLRLRAFTDGRKLDTFEERERDDNRVGFGSFSYARKPPDGIVISRDGGAEDSFTRIDSPAAPALEQADLQFNAATAARGVAGWSDWFDEHGGMWRGDGAGERIEGRSAIREHMGSVLSRPGFRLDWRPLASGLADGGELGYTVGSYQRLQLGKDGKRELRGKGAYVTIWKRQADGSWRVLFDTGDPEG
jgi:ketosteroid isomerase-like protein